MNKYIQQKQQQQFQQQLQQQLQQHQHLCLTAMQGSCMAGLVPCKALHGNKALCKAAYSLHEISYAYEISYASEISFARVRNFVDV